MSLHFYPLNLLGNPPWNNCSTKSQLQMQATQLHILWDCLGVNIIWAASSEFGTYRLCEQRRFRRACASAQSRQNLRCSLIQAVSQEEPWYRKPDPWPLWMAGHAQLKFVMTECSKTQIGLTWSIFYRSLYNNVFCVILELNIYFSFHVLLGFVYWLFFNRHEYYFTLAHNHEVIFCSLLSNSIC